MPANLGGSVRRPKRTNIRVTSRDLDIMLSLAENQFLLTSQIRALHFPSIHRTRKRLTLLYQNKYIDRMKIPSGIEDLPSESVYYIKQSGLQLLLLHGKLHEAVSIPKTGRRPGNLMFLSHTLMRNSFRVALQKSVQADSCVSLQDWRHDNSITRYVLLPDSKEQRLKRLPLKADAYFRLKLGNSEIEYFLEVDNGTMALSRLVDKMNGYYRWHLSSRQTPAGSLIRRRVLILAFSNTRAKNIADKLLSLAKTNMVNTLWLVASVERNELIQKNLLTDPVWSQPTQSGLRQVTFEQEMSEFVTRQNEVGKLYL